MLEINHLLEDVSICVEAQDYKVAIRQLKKLIKLVKSLRRN